MSDVSDAVQEVMDAFWFHAVDSGVDTQHLCIGVMSRIKQVYDECCASNDD